MFIGSFLFGGKLHSCQRAGMCMLSLISEDGNLIKIIKQAIAYRKKKSYFKTLSKTSGSISWSGGGGGVSG